MRTLLAPFTALLLGGAAPEPAEGPPVAAPPAALAADPFYSKYLDAAGIPLLSSSKVPDEALRIARSLMVEMLSHRPDLARALAAGGTRVAIMAENEGTVDLPEQRHWTKPGANDPRLTRCERKHYQERIGRLSDRDYWNARARGMAGRFTSGAAEDLLGLRSSRYYGETIFVHEFSHDVLQAIQQVDPDLYQQVQRAYAAALKRGLWKDEYASTSIDEYWAEGSQFWFNSNRLAAFGGRNILSDRDLQRYDPALYAVLACAYGARHRLTADAFYNHPARVPPGPIPKNTAEVC